MYLIWLNFLLRQTKIKLVLQYLQYKLKHPLAVPLKCIKNISLVIINAFLGQVFCLIKPRPPATFSSSLAACYFNLLLKLAVSVTQWPHGRTGDQSASAKEVLLRSDEYQLVHKYILSILNLQCGQTW